MTVPAVAIPARRIAFSFGVAGIAAVGCGVLAARPVLLSTSGRPAPALALLFGALFVVGLSLVLPEPAVVGVRSGGVFAIATALGVVAFAGGRMLMGGHAPTTLTWSAFLANALAALAEEVWFRRLCYGLVAPLGPGIAIAVSSVLFAVVHVSTYGFTVLPLDLAAGAVLGWQRAATGSWTAPAATHVLANLLVLL